MVDEIGYLPVSRDGATLFFQPINARHERASTVLTSNKGFEEWGGVLGDDVMAAALLERLLHHGHIVNIRGNSYRMRAHRNCGAPGPRRTGTDARLTGARHDGALAGGPPPRGAPKRRWQIRHARSGSPP